MNCNKTVSQFENVNAGLMLLLLILTIVSVLTMSKILAVVTIVFTLLLTFINIGHDLSRRK